MLWIHSILVEDDYGMSKDDLMAKLTENGIDGCNMSSTRQMAKNIIKAIIPNYLLELIDYVRFSRAEEALKKEIIEYCELNGTVTRAFNSRNSISIMRKVSTYEKECAFLKTNKAKHYFFPNLIYPYEFSKHNDINVKIFGDKKHKYVIRNGKKLYLPKEWSKKEAEAYCNLLFLEQLDEKSPHKYVTNNFTIDKDDIVLDVGSAEGIFSLDIIDKAKKIYIIEPSDLWIGCLEKTFHEYRHKVEIIRAFADFTTNTNNHTIRLDDIFHLEGHIDFIKMDIEGFESRAIEGLSDTLRFSKRLKLAICTYHKENDYKDIPDLLETLSGRKISYEFSNNHILLINRVPKYSKSRLTPPYFRKALVRVQL